MRGATGRTSVVAVVGVAMAAATGLVLRLWMATSRAGTIDSDVAVIGLMARHLAKGEFPVFHWGQAYAGSHEAMLAGVAFEIAGPSAMLLKLVTIALSGVVAVLIWLIGRETVGPRAGAIAGLLFWLWPAGALWWSVKPGSDYWGALCFTLATILIVIRLRRGRLRSPVWFALAGVSAGLAWWGNPQSMALLLPAAVCFAPFLVRRPGRLLLLLAGAVAGMAPWLAFNLRNSWSSFHLPPSSETYGQRLSGFLHVNGPMLLGLRVPFTYQWLVPTWVYLLFFVALAAMLVWRPPGSGLVLALTVVAPFVLAISPLSSYTAQPRYLLFLLPAVTLLIGTLLSRAWPWLAIAALCAAAVMTFAGLTRLNRPGVVAPYAPDVPVPTNLADLRTLLSDHGVRRAFGDYWLAYRTTFEMREHVLVEPVYVHRYPPIERAVRESVRPSYVFIRASKTFPEFVRWCNSDGRVCQVFERGGFALVQPDTNVYPEQYTGRW